MKNKIKSLKTLQGIINRLERNSVANKGWLVVLISTLVTVSYSQPLLRHNCWSAILFAIVILMFWFCDAYYHGLARYYRELSNSLAGDLANNNVNYLDFLSKIKGINYKEQYKRTLVNMIEGDVAPFYGFIFVAMMLFVFTTQEQVQSFNPTPVDSAYLDQQIGGLKTFMNDSIIAKQDSHVEVSNSIKDSISMLIFANKKNKVKLLPFEKYVKVNICQDTVVHKSDFEGNK